MKHVFILVLLPSFVLGCSTYSKSECKEMDAALNGFTPKQGKTHLIDKCQEDKGVAVDFVDYERGFKSGLAKLCTPEGLKALESKGIKYQRTCESYEDSMNAQETRTGELERKIRELEMEVSRLKAQCTSQE